MSPEIISIKKVNGVAGQFGYDVKVKYEDEPVRSVAFIGTTYGHSVIMVGSTGQQTYVLYPERFGPVLNPEWIRNFFA